MKINSSSFENFPLLSTDRLLLRNFHKDDLKFLYEIRSNNKIAGAMGVKRHCAVSETEKLIEDIEESFKAGTGINWVICLKDKKIPIGYVGVWKITQEHFKGEIGYALNSGYCNNGYMTEALREIIEFSFNELRLHRLEANIDSNNSNSINLLLRLKFKKEAFLREDYFINDKFHNSIIMSKLKNE